MGMAASQARFLGLSARKTNVEYQGQQVNQTRTALANESAGLFNSMMVLKVPIPPVVNNYYESRYNFDSATGLNYSISSMKETTDPNYQGGYDVVINYTKEVLTGYKLSNDPSSITLGTDGYYYGNTLLTATDAKDEANTKAIVANEAFGYPADQAFLKYVDPNDASRIYYIVAPGVPYDDPSATDYTSPMHYTAYKKSASQAKGVAMFESTQEDGRFTSAKIYGITPAEAATDIGEGTTHNLEISREYDETAYNEAMKNYDFEKMVYEKEIQDINAKTEKLQMEDRTLELKLRQLDTEQKALQTEMESVQKVIQKNVEVTFKTFA